MHVRVNAAMSADGKLASRRREPVAISGPEDFERLDRLRAEVDAVMVGVGTVLADDPSLTVDDVTQLESGEDAGSPVQPARVIADTSGRTPLDARVLNDDAETFLLASDVAPADRLAAIERTGATVIRTDGERTDLIAGLATLEDHGVERLLVEGGGELLFSLFDAALVDDLSIFVGPTIIGGRDAPTLVDGDGFLDPFPTLTLRNVERLDGGVLLHWQPASQE